MKTQTRAQWMAAQCSHVARLSPFIEAHRARRSRTQKHAVWDFMWEYYSFKPAQLLKWSPGIGVELEDGADEFKDKYWTPTPNGAALDLTQFPRHRLEGAREILNLLEQTAARAAQHGCFGLHEWAMVYRAPQTRHEIPLRLPDEQIARVGRKSNRPMFALRRLSLFYARRAPAQRAATRIA